MVFKVPLKLMTGKQQIFAVFAGQLTTDDRHRNDGRHIKKGFTTRCGVSHTDFDIDVIIDSVDRKLLLQIVQPRRALV